MAGLRGITLEFAATALPFLVISFALLYVYKRLTEHAARFATITGKGYRPRRIPLGGWRWPSLALVGGYLLLGVVLPVFVLLWTSLFGFAPPSVARLSQLSLASYANVLADGLVDKVYNLWNRNPVQVTRAYTLSRGKEARPAKPNLTSF